LWTSGKKAHIVQQQAWGAYQSEIKEEPAGRGTFAAVRTPGLLRVQATDACKTV
jgi:hypothetical protein